MIPEIPPRGHVSAHLSALALCTALLLAWVACKPASQVDDGAPSDTSPGADSGTFAESALSTANPSAAGDSSPAGGAADSAGFVLDDVGFQGPESVLHDEAADVYLVSNVNGGPTERDGNGFLSRVSPQGRLLELKWIEGAKNGVTLNAPKGLAIHGDSLFASDIDSVRIFQRETGQPMGALAVPGATFLNDLATGPEGTLYVTDTGVRVSGESMVPTGTDALYRFETGGRAVAVAKGKKLGAPNGVAVDAQGPVIVTFGSGKILRVGRDGSVKELPDAPKGQLDGLVLLGDGGMLVTSWEGKAVYHITTAGEVHDVWTDFESPADLGYDARRKRMLLPSLNGNVVEVRTTH